MNDPRRHLARERLARVLTGLDPSILERVPIHTPTGPPTPTRIPASPWWNSAHSWRKTLCIAGLNRRPFPHSAESAGPLRDLLAVVAGELSSIRDELEEHYGDQFVETDQRIPGMTGQPGDPDPDD